MDPPASILTSVAFLLLAIGIFIRWLRQTEPADAAMVRDLQCRLYATRDVLDLAHERNRVLAAALAFYADVDRWDGQRFVTCADPWAIAEAARDDDATVVSVVQASANTSAADAEIDAAEEQAAYVDGLEMAVAQYADEEHWVGREFVAHPETAPWAIAQAAQDDEQEKLAALLDRETVAPTG